MKYRLNFNNINTVAQLIDGDIQSVLENIFNLEYCGREILINIKELVIGFEENFYTGNIINDKEDISEIITLIDKYISEDDVICEIMIIQNRQSDAGIAWKQEKIPPHKTGKSLFVSCRNIVLGVPCTINVYKFSQGELAKENGGKDGNTVRNEKPFQGIP